MRLIYSAVSGFSVVILRKITQVVVMQEHEQALIAAIARLADTSDGEIGNNNNVCNLGIIFFFF